MPKRTVTWQFCCPLCEKKKKMNFREPSLMKPTFAPVPCEMCGARFLVKFIKTQKHAQFAFDVTMKPVHLSPMALDLLAEQEEEKKNAQAGSLNP